VSGEPLDALYRRYKAKPRSGLGALFVAAMDEWAQSHADNAASPLGLQARLQMVLDTAIVEQTEKLDKYLGYLATLGSEAPFIGLFGTVWGIMNSFTSIAASSDTSLAVVAPGIAEALLRRPSALLPPFRR